MDDPQILTCDVSTHNSELKVLSPVPEINSCILKNGDSDINNVADANGIDPIKGVVDVNGVAIINGVADADGVADIINGVDDTKDMVDTNAVDEVNLLLSPENKNIDSDIVEKSQSTPIKEMSSETEDDILNKFDTNDILIDDTITDKLEDKLLEDSDDLESDTGKLNKHVGDISNGTENSEIGKDCVPTKSSLENSENGDEIETIEDLLNDTENGKEEIVQNGIHEDEETEQDDGKHAEELLKDQIMDTEDLLQIVEENTDTPNGQETDHDVVDTDHENANGEESDSDKLVEAEATEELYEEFDSEPLTTDDHNMKESETKDIGAVISNEHNSDIDEELGIDAKSNEIENDDKNDMVVEDCEFLDQKAPSPISPKKENELMDIDDNETSINDIEETQIKTSKRTLSDDVETETEYKKPKLLENNIDTELKGSDDGKLIKEVKRICSLNRFSDFVRQKSIKKATLADLEEFCMQKMCEAIFHTSAIGELRHQLAVQEKMLEMWRKEVAQLTKQLRDLDIVNKRLLHELRLKPDRDKPLIPVKITRSVGLQVRCDNMTNMITPKRRLPQRPQPVNIVQAIAPKPVVKSQSPAPSKSIPIQMANAVKTTKIITPKANTLLTQALANSTSSLNTNSINKSPIKTISNNTPLRVIPVKSQAAKTVLPKVTAIITPTHTTKPVDKTFIDLTDEEDRPAATTATTTTAGMRIVKAPANSSVANNAVANSPRIMYVYNNQLHQGVLAADPNKPGGQKLMLKLNSNMMAQSNGVLTTVPGGSLTVGGSNIRPGQPVRLATSVPSVRNAPITTKSVLRHPAPLPPPPISQLSIAARKPIPPKPHLTIRRSSGGIVLSWKMPYNLDNYESIASYQLYAYQETSALPNSDMWRKVGDVKALALPMACTLTQFADGNKYHFAVRAVDVHKRMGQFSDPEQILL